VVRVDARLCGDVGGGLAIDAMILRSHLSKPLVSCAERAVLTDLGVVDHACAPAAPPRPTTAGYDCLLFVRSGVAEVWIEGRRLVTDPSQVVLIPRGASYRVRHRRCPDGTCATTLHLDGSLSIAFSDFEGGAAGGAVDVPAPALQVGSVELSYDLHVLLSLTRPAASPDRPPAEVARAIRRAVESVIARIRGLRRDGERACPRGSVLAQRAREALAARATEAVSLARIAEQLGCSRFHLCREFKAGVGLTTQQYLHRLRVSEALYRLGDGESDLLALAIDLGFSHHSHFTSVFKRLVGVPPSKVWGRAGRGE
jgi:AraC-like DNA-binding protein